jgi:hypothetical protein
MAPSTNYSHERAFYLRDYGKKVVRLAGSMSRGFGLRLLFCQNFGRKYSLILKEIYLKHYQTVSTSVYMTFFCSFSLSVSNFPSKNYQINGFHVRGSPFGLRASAASGWHVIICPWSLPSSCSSFPPPTNNHVNCHGHDKSLGKTSISRETCFVAL